MQGFRLKFLLPITAFLGLVGIFYVGLYEDPTLVPSPFIGKPAPEFSLPSLHNPTTIISEQDFQGKISLFNVWASWCPGCAQEHELLIELAEEGELPIYGLNWKDERSAALKWLARLGNPYTAVAYDRENVVGIDWGVYGAPETFLIDTDGIILYKLVGPLNREIWADEFAPRIAAVHSSTSTGGE